MLINASGDCDEVMAIIGHKTRRINKLYQHADRDEKMNRKSAIIDQIKLPKGTSGVQDAVQRAAEPADPIRNKSGRQDLNLRPLHPQCSALPG